MRAGFHWLLISPKGALHEKSEAHRSGIRCRLPARRTTAYSGYGLLPKPGRGAVMYLHDPCLLQTKKEVHAIGHRRGEARP